jgi:hypothetical protein
LSDFVTDEEVLSFALPAEHTYMNPKCGFGAQFAGFLAFYDPQAVQIEIREIASGRLLGTTDDVANSYSFGGLNCRITPDGKRKIQLGTSIRVEDASGVRHVLNGLSHGPEVIDSELSLDGRYLLIDVEVASPNPFNPRPHPVHKWIRGHLCHQRRTWRDTVVYDLEKSARLCTLAEAGMGHISADSRRFALTSDRHVDIYDFYLSKPWLHIGGYGLCAAVAVLIALYLISVPRRAFALAPRAAHQRGSPH